MVDGGRAMVRVRGTQVNKFEQVSVWSHKDPPAPFEQTNTLTDIWLKALPFQKLHMQWFDLDSMTLTLIQYELDDLVCKVRGNEENSENLSDG